MKQSNKQPPENAPEKGVPSPESTTSAALPAASDPISDASKPADAGKAEQENLLARLDEANTTIGKLSAVQAAADETEKRVLATMTKGLARTQATIVVRRQDQYDASPAGKANLARLAGRQEARLKLPSGHHPARLLQ